MSLTEHLRSCPDCAEYQSSQRALDQQLVNVLLQEPPEWLTSSILERLSPGPSTSWWAHPRLSLVLQWSFYPLLAGGLAIGLFLPIESVATWPRLVLALPSQLGVALEVLMSVIGLIPLEPITSVLDESAWVYEAAALALVFWWLRQGSAPDRSPQA
jgi:hypothetical protein